MNEQRNLLVVSGPSGCGKDTIVRYMTETYPNIELSVSATTRSPRGDECDGVNYYFLTVPQFEQYIAEGRFVEYTRYVDNYYGTPKSEVEKRIANNIVCVLVIEVEGAGNVKKLYPECTTVFVEPPSLEELARRLKKRGTESTMTYNERLRVARREMTFASGYDYRVVNEDYEACAEEIYGILTARRTK